VVSSPSRVRSDPRAPPGRRFYCWRWPASYRVESADRRRATALRLVNRLALNPRARAGGPRRQLADQGAERPAGAAGSPPLLPLVAIGPARRRRRARGSMLTAPGLNERRYCPAADSRSLISDLFIPWRAGAARRSFNM